MQNPKHDCVAKINSKNVCSCRHRTIPKMASSLHRFFESFLLITWLLSLSASLACCVKLGSLHMPLEAASAFFSYNLKEGVTLGVQKSRFGAFIGFILGLVVYSYSQFDTARSSHFFLRNYIDRMTRQEAGGRRREDDACHCTWVRLPGCFGRRGDWLSGMKQPWRPQHHRRRQTA